MEEFHLRLQTAREKLEKQLATGVEQPSSETVRELFRAGHQEGFSSRQITLFLLSHESVKPWLVPERFK